MQISVDTFGPDVARVTVSGEIDAATVGDLIAACPTATDVGAGMVLDLAGVTFIGSAGLSALLRLEADLGAAGRWLRIVDPSVPARRLFEITGSFPGVLPSTEQVGAGPARPLSSSAGAARRS